MARNKRGFGQIRKLPSGRYQSRYIGPDGLRHAAPETFQAKSDAEGWLAQERKLTEQPEVWTPPKMRVAETYRKRAAMPKFQDYAAHYLDNKRNRRGEPLQRSTRRVYESYLKNHINPAFGQLPLDQLTPALVLGWYDQLPQGKQRRECYALAKAVMAHAIAPGGPLLGSPSPFTIEGASSGASPKRETLATSSDIETITAALRPEWQLMVPLALWCGLRFGEIAELRRSDIKMKRRVIEVRRALSYAKGGHYIKGPKSSEGNRDQRIPEAIVPDIQRHLRTYVTGRDGLLFTTKTGSQITSRSFGSKKEPKGWQAARKAAGRPDLHFHDLRATGATLLAQNGAITAEIQAFLGDSTPAAADRYIRAAQGRMNMLTSRLSDLAQDGGW